MTDTTDIKALREAALKATPGPWVTVDYFWIAQEKDGHGGEFIVFDNGPDAAYVRNLSPDRILALLDQLEAERQRADAADSRLHEVSVHCANVEAELAAMKGEQVPVTIMDIQHGRADGNLFAVTLTKAGHALKDDIYELFTAPQNPVVLPGINEDLIDILGRPNFTCSGLAELLRRNGADIKRKSENEQAYVIHWLLGIYLKHGIEWRATAESELKSLAAKASAGGIVKDVE